MRLLDGGSARESKKRNSERANETCHGQTRSQRERRDRKRENQIVKLFRDSKTEEQRLEHEPLTHKSVERRHCRYGKRTEKKHRAGLWHAPQDSAHGFNVSRANRMHNCARTQEQQALENRVIQAVIQNGQQR